MVNWMVIQTVVMDLYCKATGTWGCWAMSGMFMEAALLFCLKARSMANVHCLYQFVKPFCKNDNFIGMSGGRQGGTRKENVVIHLWVPREGRMVVVLLGTSLSPSLPIFYLSPLRQPQGR